MYFWTHSEIPQAVPDTPGKLSQISWPPMSPLEPEMLITAESVTDAEIINGSSPKTPDSAGSPKELKPAAKAADILSLEEEIRRLKQEVEKYKTLIEIQALTAKTVEDFSSPIEEKSPMFGSSVSTSECLSVESDTKTLSTVNSSGVDVIFRSSDNQVKGLCEMCGATYVRSNDTLEESVDAVVPDGMLDISNASSQGSILTVISANTQIEGVRGMGDGGGRIGFISRETGVTGPPPPPPPPMPVGQLGT